MIHPDVEVVASLVIRRGAHELIRSQIRRRNGLEIRQPGGIDRSRPERRRPKRTGGQRTGGVIMLRQRRNYADGWGISRGDAISLVVAEEESLIFYDRPANAGAELILMERGFGNVSSEVKRVGVQNVGAEEFECRAVQLVGAGFRD